MELKQGSPTNEELLNLAREIGKKWRCLGRALSVPEEDLETVDEDEKKLFDKSYQMLINWKQGLGANATYENLDQGLQHSIVRRKDLSEKYCHVEGTITPHLPIPDTESMDI
jgi:hypothetical protein